MPENSYKYFKNSACKYFPCHALKNGNDYFNCMFCFCPLYSMGKDCGGNPVFLENGVKDCSNCRLPHSEGGYEHIIEKLSQNTEAKQ